MSPHELIPEDKDRNAPASVEIEFALVLSRMIESVQHDPENLRQVIYDLARYKLQEECPHVDGEIGSRSQQALEIAIRGVEDFSKKFDQLGPSQRSYPALPGRRPAAFQDNYLPLDHDVKIIDDADVSRSWFFAARTWILIASFAVVASGIAFATIVMNGRPAPTQTVVPSVATLPSPVVPPLVTKPTRLLPTDYGVYAVSDGKLIELKQLERRPPDIRVAISAAITAQPQTILSNGHPKFIVFRRDVASIISDKVDVRVIAKVASEFSPGKHSDEASKAQETWVMRNISFPFRASPVAESPDMYELHGDDDAAELTPGRYALVLKNTAYDFSIAGKPVDPRQCLERVVATNGTFYSECRKP